MLFKTIKKIDHANEIEEQRKTIPAFHFLNVYSNLVFSYSDLDNNKSLIFIYFNTECEYCIYEAEEISKNIQAFAGCQILMVSIESPKLLIQFAEKYNLSNIDNLYILYDKELCFEKTFGINPYPSCLIYNKSGKLVKHFKGEVKIDALTKYIFDES